MPKRKQKISRELIREQNEEFEALLAQEKEKQEISESLEVIFQTQLRKMKIKRFSLQRRMVLAGELLGPEPAPKSDDFTLIRIYTPEGCYTRRFPRQNLMEAIHLYLNSLGHFEADLRTYDGQRINKTLCTYKLYKGLSLYLASSQKPQ